MLSLNKAALLAALAVSVSVGGYVLVDKYNGAIALSESLTEKNNALTDKLAKLGVELQSSDVLCFGDTNGVIDATIEGAEEQTGSN
mgnify:CR=1 FL=1